MNPETIKYFEICYELLPFPVEVFDEKGFVVYVNSAFSQRWGYDISELNGYSYNEDDELIKRNIAEKINDVLQNNNSIQLKNYGDSRLLGADRAAPFLSTTIFSVNLEKNKYVVLFHEDQTDVLLAEEEVKKARDASKAVNWVSSLWVCYPGGGG